MGHLGIQPSEFYRMRPQEFFLLWETKRPRQDWEYQGSLSEKDLAQLYKKLHEDD